jgi:two-component system nitrogen regulation response regulator NtrX
MSNVLIIDDEEGIRQVLSDILEDEGHTALVAGDGPEGLELLKNNLVDLIFLDVWMPNMGGLDVLARVKEDFPGVEVVMISGHGNIDMAVKAIKNGAFDFVEKPLSIDRVITIMGNASKLSSLRQENIALKTSLFLEDQMIGESSGMKSVKDLIRQSAPSDARVMILGDNGTGKELVARQIHLQSPRADKPFVEVNCAAIPDNLIESELFGHEKGAFTSAIARRKGKFEAANQGTLFLDEIADMSLEAQAKVLRAVQEMRFERVGGNESIEVDVRIITATNKDLKEEVKAGRFREDLFFRLNVIPIRLPSLKDRKEDIPLLLDYFLRKFQKKNGGETQGFTPESLKILEEHTWPGNIRELKNFVERVLLMTDEAMIPLEAVDFYLEKGTGSEVESFTKEFQNMSLSDAKDKFEIQFIVEKLQDNEYNLSRTAQALGIYPSNLHGKIKKFGIETTK